MNINLYCGTIIPDIADPQFDPHRSYKAFKEWAKEKLHSASTANRIYPWDISSWVLTSLETSNHVYFVAQEKAIELQHIWELAGLIIRIESIPAEMYTLS